MEVGIILIVLIVIVGIFEYKQISQYKNLIKEKDNQYAQLQDEYSKLKEELISSKTRIEVFQNEINELKKELSIKENRINELLQENTHLHTENSKYNEQVKHLNDLLKKQAEDFQQMQQHLKTEFENLSNKILEHNTQKLTQQNEQILINAISPVREHLSRIKELEQKIQTFYDNENKERASLKTIIETLTQRSDEVKQTAEKLVSALTSQVKYQGNWGEMILEKLLEISGLQENVHYKIQKKDNDKQPDVTILLPQDKYIIIDSKVTLNAFMEYQSATSEQEKEQYAKMVLQSIKNHYNNLSDKEYHKIYNTSSTPDFVLMFIPIEGVLNVIQQYDTQLFNDAIRKKVLMVTPTTLLATLKTIYYVWQQEKRREEFEDILQSIQALHDKLRVFVEHFTKIEEKLKDALNAFDDAKKSLTTGKGNAMSIITKKIEPYIVPKNKITKLPPENDE
ncbi:MAG: DNA recombination protein RmuC [Bacteroidota bacterium]